MDDKVNILIVDDLAEKQLVYQSVLEELGENLVPAGSGAEALREVLRRDFAVILLDVNMPGMDGFETAALIRQRRKSAHTPIIFVTAFTDDMRQAQGYALGAVDYILTPVVPEVLRAKVKVFVDLFRMTQQVRRQGEERVALTEERLRREAAEESSRRLGFSARAGTILGRSLDLELTARDLAGLSVPLLADFSAVVRTDTPGGAWHVDLARAPADGPPGEVITGGRNLLAEALVPVVARVLAGGSGELLPDSIAPVTLVLPLRVRGHTLGVLVLSTEASGRRFDPGERSLAEALASRAAVALDNARLHRDLQEADRRKNEFLAMLGHELRNPLAPIRNGIHILRLTSPADPALLDVCDLIDRQLTHMVRLVDDLLDVSRITQGKIQLRPELLNAADVVAVAVETCRPYLESRRHVLDLELPSEPVRVLADVARLGQVLANLLHNAAKYTEEGGHISLRVAPEGTEAVFRVRDSGVGIPPEMLARVFELFTQVDGSIDRAEGGLGIGLTLVRRLVEMHGGSVQAQSAGPGKGSEFVVRLPLVKADSATMTDDGGGQTEEYENESATRHPATCRVLVVDDNRAAADTFALLLRVNGHDVRTAYDGPEALETAAAFLPEVVFADIGLPGMDGYELARNLRALPGLTGTALVALTGYGLEEDRRRSRAAGFDHHIIKPIEPEALPALFTALRGRASPLLSH